MTELETALSEWAFSKHLAVFRTPMQWVVTVRNRGGVITVGRGGTREMALQMAYELWGQLEGRERPR